MPSRNPAPAAAALVVAIASLVVACSGGAATASRVPQPSGAPSPVPAETPTGLAKLVLRVTIEGGFIAPAAHLAQLPEVVVYADGRILTPAPVPAIYPAPLVPVDSVRDVGAVGVAAIRAAIKAAGLAAGGGTNPGIGADAADTVFTVQVGDQTISTRFPALGMSGSGPGRPGLRGASADPQRTAVLVLLARLTDPADTWGGPAAQAAQYVPTAYRIFVAPGAPVAPDPATAQPPIAWPLAAPLASFGTPAVPDRGISGLRVGVVSAADATTLAPLLAAATQITPFISGGATFTLYVSPLLPDEPAG